MGLIEFRCISASTRVQRVPKYMTEPQKKWGNEVIDSGDHQNSPQPDDKTDRYSQQNQP